METKKEIIIDLEFTGLDNTYITDNEIVQMKAYNTDNGKSICCNFNSNKKISAYGFLSHKVERYSKSTIFKITEFVKTLELIDVNYYSDENKYFGFGTSQDKLMLNKYGITLEISDIREMLQLSKHEQRLATEGSGLEAAYYIVTGKLPNLENHDGEQEILIISELFQEAIKPTDKEFLTVMPHGFCAGMPLEQYFDLYRRQADGYRFNNTDLLSISLNELAEAENYDPRNEENFFGEEEEEFEDEEPNPNEENDDDLPF